MARVYIAAILVAQAIVNGLERTESPTATTVLVLSAVALLLPLVGRWPSMVLRAVTTLPAIGASVYWAIQAVPFGTVAWAAWAALTAWLCLPATPHLTFAERFHPRPRTDA